MAKARTGSAMGRHTCDNRTYWVGGFLGPSGRPVTVGLHVAEVGHRTIWGEVCYSGYFHR